MDKKFGIVVYLNTPNAKYPIPVNVAETFNKKKEGVADVSYTSYDGLHWNEIMTYFDTGNAALKAFTKK